MDYNEAMDIIQRYHNTNSLNEAIRLTREAIEKRKELPDDVRNAYGRVMFQFGLFE